MTLTCHAFVPQKKEIRNVYLHILVVEEGLLVALVHDMHNIKMGDSSSQREQCGNLMESPATFVVPSQSLKEGESMQTR